MKFSESWLRTFINPKLTANQLSYALTMAGLEIESLSRVMPEISKIVVGQIIEISKNTSSKKLNVCQVDIGRRTPLHIVCSASNVRQGIKIPVAFVDAELPIMKENGKSLINRIESQGMLCSKNDLKLSEDHVRVLILPEDLQIGQDISNALNLNDMIFEIKLTPNRADCLSVFGIAREIAAITGSPLTPIDIYPVQVELDDILPVKITAPDLCGRFSGRVIRDVNVHVKTPNWMIQRLEQSGQRSVSTLIDISNYVMLELGQPSHLSDLDKISGGIYIRWGNDNESLKLLNGDTIELDNKVGVVADMSKIGSLAGIIGGHSTAVTLDTKNIYIESAFWCPSSIQGRARKYGLSTEAAHRFERGVDYAATVKSIERITKLILDICGGRAGPVDDHIINLPKRFPVEVRISKVNRIICASLNTRDVERIFNRLDMSFKKKGDVFSVTPPSYRFDIEIEEDLIEEIARIHGFEKIPERLPKSINKIHVSKETQRSIHDVRHMLAARDYIETINFSFVSSECEHDFSEKNKPIHLLNPISKQFSVMRSTLFGGLISVLLYNLKRQVYRIRIFEIGSIFISDPSVRDTELTVKGYAQPKRVCVLAYGPAFDLQWGISRRNIDFFDVKGDLEALLFPSNAHFVKASHPALHPGRSAKIKIDGQEAISGWIGELHPKLMQKYELPYPPILFEIDADALIFRMIPRISNVSKFPLVQRDISIIVNESIEVQSLLNDMKRALIEGDRRFIKSIILFDQFSSKKSTSKQRTLDSLSAEEKSLTFRVTLQDLECTLRDEIVNQLIQTIISRITNKYGARLRRP